MRRKLSDGTRACLPYTRSQTLLLATEDSLWGAIDSRARRNRWQTSRDISNQVQRKNRAQSKLGGMFGIGKSWPGALFGDLHATPACLPSLTSRGVVWCGIMDPSHTKHLPWSIKPLGRALPMCWVKHPKEDMIRTRQPQRRFLLRRVLRKDLRAPVRQPEGVRRDNTTALLFHGYNRKRLVY